MAAPVFVAVLSAAAEAYSKQLAATVGAGIVETLFHQEQIARDLNEIKQMVAALSEFIRTKLPALIERSVDLGLARKAEFDVVEKAVTIAGSIATLERARKDGAAESQIQFIGSELAGHADSILEMGGALVSYGQPYYASVGIAFGAALKAFAAVTQVAPERIEALHVRAASWKVRLAPWVDATRPTSLAGVREHLEARQALGARTVPSFETWNTHTTREVAISWRSLGDQVLVAGAWFGYYKDGRGLQGDTLAWLLDPGSTFAAPQVNRSSPSFTLPEWWAVKEDVPGSRVDYEQCAHDLSQLIAEYYSYPEVAPAANGAVSLMTETLKHIDRILDEAKHLAEGKTPPQLAVGVTTDEDRLKRVEAVLSLNRPGLGLTRAF